MDFIALVQKEDRNKYIDQVYEVVICRDYDWNKFEDGILGISVKESLAKLKNQS